VRSVFSAAGDDVTGSDVADTGSDSLYAAGRTVSERRKGFEPIPDGIDRRGQAVGSHFVHDLAHLIRAPAGLAQEAIAAYLDLRAFGAGANKRRQRPDEHLPVVQLGRRDVDRAEAPVLHSLRKLFHAAAPSFATARWR
jgi:hypothetical protein